MPLRLTPHSISTALLSAALLLLASTPLLAQIQPGARVPGPSAQPSTKQFQKGTSYEAIADPNIPRPSTKPCVVTLLDNQPFENFNNADYTYTPPSDCRGPWAKVILTADFSIQPGVQFDRSGTLFLGGVNIFFGTTAEPLQTQTDTWHVERDLTDYSSLFKTTQSGYAFLGNIVGTDGLNSIIFGTFKLEFYPANFLNPAPTPADLVIGLPTNGTTNLDNGTPELTQTVTLPTNVESAYLDVIAQSQNEEEQWFFCLPNAVAGSVGVCGNTAFRQVNVSIDGTLAGVAPVYPWIYTGGVDPGLWIPIPGVQTLNLLPYRVDLTPFAGLLSNGQPHTVGITVFNAFEYFTTEAALLVYEDHGSKKITGEVTENTLTTPNPVLVNHITTDSSGNVTGTATVTSKQSFTIAGYINTSHGRVSTKVQQDVNFSNVQSITDTATQFGQGVVQTSTVSGKTTIQTGPLTTAKETTISYPITINYLETLETNNNIDQTSNVDQGFQKSETESFGGFPIFQSSTSNEVTSTDTAIFVPTPTGYGLSSTTGQSSKQNYVYKDSLGNCYSRMLTAANNLLTGVTDQQACHGHYF